tara:strand:- start:149 stop:334 length:186 start_codon:yes stop_codon:yes gene_type:complete
MKNIFINIRKKFLLNRNGRHLIAASNLEKKAINLNLRSEEYVKLAKRNNDNWRKKWLKVIK